MPIGVDSLTCIALLLQTVSQSLQSVICLLGRLGRATRLSLLHSNEHIVLEQGMIHSRA